MLIIMLNFMLEKVHIQPYVCLKHEVSTVLSEAKQTEQLKPVTCNL